MFSFLPPPPPSGAPACFPENRAPRTPPCRPRTPEVGRRTQDSGKRSFSSLRRRRRVVGAPLRVWPGFAPAGQAGGASRTSTYGDPTSPFWRRSALGFLWREWCWNWNSSTLATSCEELTHWKRLWCWEGLGAGGEGDDRGWDGWMASWTRRTWVWVNSGSWWWTGRPGVLQFMGSLRFGQDWVTELNWTEEWLIWRNTYTRYWQERWRNWNIVSIFVHD